MSPLVIPSLGNSTFPALYTWTLFRPALSFSTVIAVPPPVTADDPAPAASLTRIAHPRRRSLAARWTPRYPLAGRLPLAYVPNFRPVPRPALGRGGKPP